METNILKLDAKQVDPATLSIPKATAFYNAVVVSHFSTITDVLKDMQGREIIVVETEVEVPQYPKVDVRRKEIFAAVFDPADQQLPRAWMLREDFPELPHLLLELTEKPRSLCLYNMPYDDVKLFWTGFLFLERIREWLKLSATGELHQNDQPLEPLLLSDEGMVLLPSEMPGKEVFMYMVGNDYYGKPTLMVTNTPLPIAGKLFPCHLEHIIAKPQVHGIIKHSPRDLHSLGELLKAGGIDLAGYLKNKLQEYKGAKIKLDHRMLFLVDLPKTREEGAAPTDADHFVFLTYDTVEEIGKKLNIWSEAPKGMELAMVLFEPFNTESLKTIGIGMLRPIKPFHRKLANVMNGVEEANGERKIFALGAGALGSQVVLNLVRAGVGRWGVADADVLLPHNLSRNGLNGIDILTGKAVGLARLANSILPGSVVPFFSNIIYDKDDVKLKEAITSADLVIDMSASSAALKSLADITGRNRVVSFFMNPSGNDFVAIVQDKELKIPSTALEIQYLRFLLHTDTLKDHFKKEGEPIRYAGGCRDISFVLPQDSVSLAASLASKYVRQLCTDEKPGIKIWRTDPATLETKVYEARVYQPLVQNMGEWTVVYDDYVVDKIYEQRREKLPNETGGVLIGSYDMLRKVVFVADIVGSPPDSYEYPTAYIRGIKDLGRELDRIRDITAGGLQYIGEWHSHPDGYGPRMSSDDMLLFTWLYENMYKEGLPAMMFIAGEKRDYGFYISENQ